MSDEPKRSGGGVRGLGDAGVLRGAGHELASSLGPALIERCGGRLSKVDWFRSSWQAGGSGTGFATYTLDDGRTTDVVVKLPVGYKEYFWTTRMAEAATAGGPAVTPAVLAAGLEVGGYDFAWLVVERLPGHPIAHDLSERCVRDLIETAVSWYQAAAGAQTPSDPPPPPNWKEHLERARKAIREQEVPEAARWHDAVKHVLKSLPRLMEQWVNRPINTWCHGDFHPGNAMRRPAEGHSPIVLIDLALVHAGHWTEDAVYLERLYWGRPEMLHGVKPVSVMAKVLRERRLLGAEDYARLANIRRVLMGATAPAFLGREGHPRYLHAALETVERILPLIAK